MYIFDPRHCYPIKVAEDVAKAFGETVRHYRTQKGWSQMKLAMEAGLHLNALGNLERGRRSPSLQTVLLISDALGIKAGELVDKVVAEANL